eukprot:COSAG05_NODE_787_length_7335_cov_30.078220_6_plen_151_part_00
MAAWWDAQATSSRIATVVGAIATLLLLCVCATQLLTCKNSSSSLRNSPTIDGVDEGLLASAERDVHMHACDRASDAAPASGSARRHSGSQPGDGSSSQPFASGDSDGDARRSNSRRASGAVSANSTSINRRKFAQNLETTEIYPHFLLQL